MIIDLLILLHYRKVVLAFQTTFIPSSNWDLPFLHKPSLPYQTLLPSDFATFFSNLGPLFLIHPRF